MLIEHEIEIRVRYQETDGQGRVHHANYLTYFESGRIELMRAAGWNYRDLEASGIAFVVSEAHIRYFRPAHYDDLLLLKTKTIRAKGARIEHHYLIEREGERLVEGKTVIACISSEGQIHRIPEYMLIQ